MHTIKVKPVEFVGPCLAGLAGDDEFQITGNRLENPRQSTLCWLALGHFPPVVKLLQQGKHFYGHVSCPDCLARLDQEHRVVFLLGHADKWDLCQAISEYQRCCQQVKAEPEPAKRLRSWASRLQKNGDYLAATGYMRAALAILKRAGGP